MKNRMPALEEENRDKLFKYIWGIMKNKKCHLYRINGIEDHLHIVTDLHQTVALASLVKDIKLGANDSIEKENLFPKFTGWQEGYGAFTYSYDAKDRVIAYVKNQKEHHKTMTFKEEYKALLEEHKIEFDEKYLL